MRSPWLWALLAVTSVRLAVAAATPLLPDEAYYWVWSRALQPGYLDHPPMVALFVWIGTALCGDTALGVRLLAPVAAALGSVMLADAGARLFGPGRGLRAAVLLNATLMFGVGAVTMTPDTPLLLFWTAAAWALARVATGGGAGWWLVVGLAGGLALDSKYTAALLGVGVVAWLLLAGRRWLWTPWPWLGGAVAVVAVLPVLLWNAGHGWASLLRQGGRVAAWDPARAGGFLLELLGGQLGLATPWIALLFVAGVAAAVRTAWRSRQAGAVLVVALVVPGLLLFVQHALGDRVQANWVAVLYPGCALATCGARRWRPAAALGAGLTLLLYVQSSLAPLPLPRTLDPSLRLAGWDGLAQAMAARARQEGAGFLASEEYGAASLLAWSAPGLPVFGMEPRWRLFDRPLGAPGGTGLLLVSTRRSEPPDPEAWRSAEPAGTLTRGRGGVPAETYLLYRVEARPGAPALRLP